MVMDDPIHISMPHNRDHSIWSLSPPIGVNQIRMFALLCHLANANVLLCQAQPDVSFPYPEGKN